MLRHELARPSYTVSPINIGSNTDPYQPIERRWKLTRAALEVLAECRHPCTIVTKNAMVERDLDILAPMARDNLVQVLVSVNSLDNHLAAKLEPRSSAPHRRIKAIRSLRDAGVPVGVCGEMGGRPLEAMAILGLGINRLSITPAAVGPVKAMIRSLDLVALREAMPAWLAEAPRDLRARMESWADERRVAIL